MLLHALLRGKDRDSGSLESSAVPSGSLVDRTPTGDGALRPGKVTRTWAWQTGWFDVPAHPHSFPWSQLQSHHGDVVVEIGAHVELRMEVDGLDVELLLVDVGNILVPVTNPSSVDLLGVILDTVGGGEKMAPSDKHRPAPVEAPGVAAHPDARRPWL